jgi:peptidylprolyl isomerase
MPTDKRLRQRQGRAERLAAERAAARRASRRRRLVTGVVVGLLVVGTLALLSQFGSDDDGGEPAADEAPSTTTTGPPADKPEVTVPEGPVPTELQSEDLTVGEGPEATAGSTVTVNYVGVAYSTGKEFDTSYGREPFPFELGAGGVIKGWDQGVVGMKVGGRRQLVIPPDLAYGERGQPPDIGPNETLIFVIDLLEVASPGEPSGG